MDEELEPIERLLMAVSEELSSSRGWPSRAFEDGTDVAVWLVRSEAASPALRERVAKELESLYRGGDTGQRRFLVNVILEHAFEQDHSRALFREWRTDPELRVAYEEAEAWAQPLRETRQKLVRLAEKCARRLRRDGTEVLSVSPYLLGTEAVWIRWRPMDKDVPETLVLTGPEEATESFEGDLVEYVLDRRNWRASEDLDDEWIVAVPE